MPTDKEMLDWLNDNPLSVEYIETIPRTVTWRTKEGYGSHNLRAAIIRAMEEEAKAELDKAWKWFRASGNCIAKRVTNTTTPYNKVCDVQSYVLEPGDKEKIESAILSAWREDTETQGKE